MSIRAAITLFLGLAGLVGAGQQPVASDNGPQIPSGTTIAVTTIDRIESDKSSPGQTFRASLADPLVVNESTLAPVGATAYLKVVEAKKAGKLEGKAELTIALFQVRIGNQLVPITADYSKSASGGKGKSSALKTGGGAALGALIGGLAGGGKGAAIGAGAGAAGGATLSMMTGPKVVVPPETRLSFVVR